MNEEKKQLFKKVNELIDKRKNELLKNLPNIHEIEDGIIIRSFYDWKCCDDFQDVKFKKIPAINKPQEIVFFYYLPKGTIFEKCEKKHISSITCLTGNVEISVDDKKYNLNAYNKIYLGNNKFSCKILENTYLITSNIE